MGMLCVLSTACLLIRIGEGIIIRSDKVDSDYRVDASAYPAVFSYPNTVKRGVNCAATLVDSAHAITAAHCFDPDSPQPPFPVTIQGKKFVVKKALVHPCFSFDEDGPNSADLAVLVLSKDSSTVPIPVYDSTDEVGKTFTFVGWGDTGPAGSSTPAEKNGGGILRRAQNVFTAVEGNTLKYVMDAPKDGALEHEGMGWSGDSGGPAFIESDGKLHIAGVNSGGECCEYGSTDQFVRLSSELSQDWIEASIDANSAQSVKDCSAWGSTGGHPDDDHPDDDHPDDGHPDDDHPDDDDPDDHHDARLFELGMISGKLGSGHGVWVWPIALATMLFVSLGLLSLTLRRGVQAFGSVQRSHSDPVE